MHTMDFVITNILHQNIFISFERCAFFAAFRTGCKSEQVEKGALSVSIVLQHFRLVASENEVSVSV